MSSKEIYPKATSLAPITKSVTLFNEDSGFLSTLDSPNIRKLSNKTIERSAAVDDLSSVPLDDDVAAENTADSIIPQSLVTQHKKKWWNIFPGSTASRKKKALAEADNVEFLKPSPNSDRPGEASDYLKSVPEEQEEVELVNGFKVVSIDDADISPSTTKSKVKTIKAVDSGKSSWMKFLSIGSKKRNDVSNFANEENKTLTTDSKIIKVPGPHPTLKRRIPSKSDEEAKELRKKEIVQIIRGKVALPEDLLKKYRLLDLLGDGAFGFVFAAKIIASNDKEAAVKFIIRDRVPVDGWVLDDQYGYIPFEAHFLKQVSHPNIIKLLDLYQDERFVYLVTEIHGVEWNPSNPLFNAKQNPGIRLSQSTSAPKIAVMNLNHAEFTDEELLRRKRTSCDLFECIDAHRKIPEHTAKFIFAQIVDALLYLSRLGFVHRDLKDENVVIDQHYFVKLIDFGSASRIPKLGDTGNYFDRFNGTLHFAAPEILEGKFYRGPEADIWALGVLLYIILYSENPFPAPEDILRKQIRYPPEPELAVDLIQSMLQTDPECRITLEQVKNHRWLSSLS